MMRVTIFEKEVYIINVQFTRKLYDLIAYFY